MTAEPASTFLAGAFAVLTAGVALGLVWLVYRAVGRRMATQLGLAIAVLMLAQFAVAASGILRQWDRRPPPLFPLIAGMLLLTVVFAVRSPAALVRNNSLAAIIGLQAFRLPLELLMHRAAQEGVMPEQMSYSGYNFDILTGASAAILALLLARGQGSAPAPWLLNAVRLWNLAGFCLLCNVVSIAIASLPVFHAFGDSPERLNTWVAGPPFIWLPGILVPTALLGHIFVWRKLRLV